MSCSTGRPSQYSNADASKRRCAAARQASSTASGRSAISSGSSITWKIRSPDAVARCAWPIHMPSERSGMISIAEVEVERDEAADASARRSSTMRAPTSRTAGLREHRHPGDERDVERALPVGAQRLLEDRLRSGRVNFSCSCGSCANDFTTWTPTMFSSATVATSASSAARRAASDARRGCSGRRARRATGVIASAISASFHSKKKSTHGHRDNGEDVLEEEDQPVAEEEAHALQVDGRPRHQLSGLVAVVEAEREPHEVRVEPLAHVHLDRERLLSGDQPASGHEDRRATRRGRRSPRRSIQSLSGVARRDCVVDHVRVTHTSAICAPCERDCEERRDDRARLVGAQEAEQAGECHPIRRSAVLLHP